MSTAIKEQNSLSDYFEGHDQTKVGKTVMDSVKSYEVVLKIALETVARVENGQIPDPTVGENACQIRAALYSEILNADALNQNLEKAKNALEKAKGGLKEAIPLGKRETASLDNFLKANDAHVFLDVGVHLLVLGYILEKTKTAERKFGKDPLFEGRGVQPLEKVVEKKELEQEGLSKTAAQNIEKYAKKTLAKYSVLIVQKWAKNLPDPIQSQRLLPLVSGLNVKTTQLGLETVPCFSSSEVWLDVVCRQGTPFILRISRVSAETGELQGKEVFFFVPNKGRYEPCREAAVMLKPAAIFIDAASIAEPVLSRDELDQELKKREIRETFLAFLATHPVYGGDAKHEPAPAEEEKTRVLYVERARDWGCCPENPQICRLFHIYAVSTNHWREAV